MGPNETLQSLMKETTMITRTYGIKVTQENIYALVTFASHNQLDLSNISDAKALNAAKGLETYVVLYRNVTTSVQTIAMLDEMEFFGNWEFHNGNIVTVTALDFFQEVQAV